MKYRLMVIAILAAMAFSYKPAQAQIVASLSLQTANCPSFGAANDTLLYIVQNITLNSQTVIVQLAQGSSNGVVIAVVPPGQFVTETINATVQPHTSYTFFLLEGVPSNIGQGSIISTPIPYTTVSVAQQFCS